MVQIDQFQEGIAINGLYTKGNMRNRDSSAFLPGFQLLPMLNILRGCLGFGVSRPNAGFLGSDNEKLGKGP